MDLAAGPRSSFSRSWRRTAWAFCWVAVLTAITPAAAGLPFQGDTPTSSLRRLNLESAPLGLLQGVLTWSDTIANLLPGKPPPPSLDWTTVFPLDEGDEGDCYRIPSIIRTRNGGLLAFAERRYGGCDDDTPHDLVLKRSWDKGNTWGDMITAVHGHKQPISNPNPVEVDLGYGKTAILLHYDTRNNPNETWRGSNMQVWSYDQGKTWENTKNITHIMPAEMRGCMPGPAVGIQAPSGTIYFTCHGFGQRALIYFSKDLGESWHASQVVGDVDECSLALMPSQNLVMNCRGGENTTFRRWATWSPAAELIDGPIVTRTARDPNCQGSIVQFGGTLFMSNDDNDTRTHLTMKYSQDHGKTWEMGQSLHTAFSAYSQLVVFPQGADSSGDVPSFTMGVLAEIGCEEYDRGIAFKRFNTVHEQPKHKGHCGSQT